MADEPFKRSDRQQQCQRQWEYYNGNPPKPLKTRPNGVDDNLIMSLGRLVVDKGASFLFGQEVIGQVVGGQAEPQQAWLDECWRRNKRSITLLKISTNGGIFGHAFIRLLDTKPWPRLIILDPQMLDVLTDPDDVDAVWAYTITPPPQVVPGDEKPVERRTRISTPSGQAGYAVDLPEDIAPEDELWFIEDQEFRAGEWITIQQSQWPYPFCPIFQCQNLPKPNDFWGESDLPDDVLHILAAINRVASNYNKIIRLHAHPKIWTRGMGARKLDLAIDAVTHLPSETAEMKALEMQSDLASTLEFLNKLLSMLSYMVRIPMVAMGEPDNLGSISGVALQIRYQPLLEKNEAKRLTYGDMLSELDRCLLLMNDVPNPGPTQLQWPEVVPSDPLMERQTWVIDESLGLVSTETLSDKAGYDFDEEQKRLTVQKAQAVKDAQAAMGTAQPGALQPNGEMVPPPAPFGGPGTTVMPDIAKKAKSS